MITDQLARNTKQLIGPAELFTLSASFLSVPYHTSLISPKDVLTEVYARVKLWRDKSLPRAQDDSGVEGFGSKFGVVGELSGFVSS